MRLQNSLLKTYMIGQIIKKACPNVHCGQAQFNLIELGSYHAILLWILLL
jgi:hypothetical protein